MRDSPKSERFASDMRSCGTRRRNRRGQILNVDLHAHNFFNSVNELRRRQRKQLRISARKKKKKIAEKREVWTSGQLDSVPSPTEGLRAPGLTTGPHMYSTEIGSVIYV